MHHGRPLSRKKIAQLTVGLFILAWATQTLFQQWGFGQEVGGAGAERFVPAPAGGRAQLAPGGATLEVRSEATIVGREVRLKQVCRWSDADAPALAPIAELVLVRLAENGPFRGVGVDEIKGTLRDAGVNLATLNFVGATSCTVGRGDVQFDEGAALQQWIDAKQAAATEPPAMAAAAATQPAKPVATSDERKAVHTLRDVLASDLADRLQLKPETLQINFRAQDEKLLNLSEPHFHFEVRGQRARALGDVAWDVGVLSSTGGAAQKATVAANARAWQEQLVVARPISTRQVIRDEDLMERRALVDLLGDDPLLTRAQAVNQQAARDLKPGMMLTARHVEAVPLARTGQFVTVTLSQGRVQVKTVCRALEGGSFGQTIRVKNETNKDVFRVTLTGPQTATMVTGDSVAASATAGG